VREPAGDSTGFEVAEVFGIAAASGCQACNQVAHPAATNSAKPRGVDDGSPPVACARSTIPFTCAA
jgi:hypothetical protein